MALADEFNPPKPTSEQMGRALLGELGKARGECDIQKALTLINNGADINARDAGGYTPLMYAAMTGLTEVAAALVDKGADTSARGYETCEGALATALRFGSRDIAILLIKKGDIRAFNQYDSDGYFTTLESVRISKDAELVKLMESRIARETAQKKKPTSPKNPGLGG